MDNTCDSAENFINELSGRELAGVFHNIYEKLAPQYGYETRKDTKAFDANSPNGKLMIATCDEIIAILRICTDTTHDEINRMDFILAI